MRLTMLVGERERERERGGEGKQNIVTKCEWKRARACA